MVEFKEYTAVNFPKHVQIPITQDFSEIYGLFLTVEQIFSEMRLERYFYIQNIQFLKIDLVISGAKMMYLLDPSSQATAVKLATSLDPSMTGITLPVSNI